MSQGHHDRQAARHRTQLRAALFGLVLAVILGACATPEQAVSVFLSDGAALRPLANGSRIALDGATVELRFTPYPPRSQSELDVVVRDGAGALVPSDVRVVARMLDMDHAPLVVVARADGGHHRVAIDLGPNDAWQLIVYVARAGQRDNLVLVVPAR